MSTAVEELTLPDAIATKLSPDNQAILLRHPGAIENLTQFIDSPPFPGNTLIDTFELFADEIPVYAEVDGEVTLAVEAPEGDIQVEICEMAINGELAMVKVGDQIVLNRIDEIAKHSMNFKQKLSSLPV
ncbi:MAG TPA: hypothetical protein V6D19_21405 [Stenomitos sp.]